MTHARLALSLSDKTHHILSVSEAPNPIRSYNWYGLLSHARTADPSVIQRIIGKDNKVALNALPPVPIKHEGGRASFKSLLNGEKLSFSLDELLGLKTMFEYIILPQSYGERPEKRLFVLNETEWASTSLAFDASTMSDNDLISKLTNYKKQLPDVLMLVCGVSSREMSQVLSQKGVDFIETSIPLEGALKGRVESDEGIIDLSLREHVAAHYPIQESCDCYTCEHHTRAYLHHLIHYTPLLAIKLQAIHNVHLWAKSMAFH